MSRLRPSIPWFRFAPLPTSAAGTVTSVASADASITVTNPNTTVDLKVIKATSGFTVSGGDLAIGANNLTMTGSIAATGSRVTKIWTTDIEMSNLPSVNGTALTTTVAKLNLLTSAGGTTGTNTTNIVFSTSPSLTTPALGVATATSINGLIITTTAGTLTIANNASASLITSGNFALTLTTTTTTNSTFPAGTDTLGGLGTIQTWTVLNTFKQINWTNNAITASSNAATVPITHRLNTVTNDSAGNMTITMTTTSAVDGQLVMVRIIDFSAVAKTITWVNTENSTVSAPTTSNGSTTLFLTVGFIYNSGTSKWRCVASA